jgi:hypothetical protein
MVQEPIQKAKSKKLKAESRKRKEKYLNRSFDCINCKFNKKPLSNQERGWGEVLILTSLSFLQV